MRADDDRSRNGRWGGLQSGVGITAGILLFGLLLRLLFQVGFQGVDDFLYLKVGRSILDGTYDFGDGNSS